VNKVGDQRHAWEGVIPDDDMDIYHHAGFGRRGGLGTRPAIIIIDVQYRTVGPARAPIREAMKTFPTACGEAGWNAVDSIVELVSAGRTKGVPVIYPCVAPKVQGEGGRLAGKVPAIMGIEQRGYDFVDEIAPAAGDIVVPKKHPSAFFGTALASHLIDMRVDTLLMCGCTTSGCIRASTADAFAFNFRTAVVEECVYDRGKLSHAVNLFDIDQKYADVIWLEDALAYIESLPSQD
jgi:maleamate amidohydrolase